MMQWLLSKKDPLASESSAVRTEANLTAARRESKTLEARTDSGARKRNGGSMSPSYPLRSAAQPVGGLGSADSRTCAALYVVYDADGTRTGELLYILRKLLGIAHCAACDITHGPRTEKPEFTQLKNAGWNMPVHNIHRDEMDEQLAQTVGLTLPVVAARTRAGNDYVLLGPEQLDDCCGSVASLEASINAALAGSSLSTPSFPALPPRSAPRQLPDSPLVSLDTDDFMAIDSEDTTLAADAEDASLTADTEHASLTADADDASLSVYTDAVSTPSFSLTHEYREPDTDQKLAESGNVGQIRLFEESMARQWYSNPSDSSAMIGITGMEPNMFVKGRVGRSSRKLRSHSQGSDGHGDAVVPDRPT